jgi:hypothetical protein
VAFDPHWFRYPMAFGSVGLFVLMVIKAVTTKSLLPETSAGVSNLWNAPAPKYSGNAK